MGNHTPLIRAITVAFVASLISLVLHHSDSLHRLEGLSYDQRLNFWRSNTHADEQIAVVLIDDNSLKAMDSMAGRWPWPRSVYADLLEFFAMGEAKAVLFDITFFEKQLTNEKDLNNINDHDLRLAEASATYPFAYHAARFVLDTEDDKNKGLLNQPLPPDFISKFSVSHRLKLNGMPAATVELDTPSNTAYYIPFPELAESAMSFGVVDVSGEKDGVYRTARLFHRYQKDFFPSLSTTSLIDFKSPASIKRVGSNIEFGDTKIPVDKEERYWVNYYDNYDTYSFSGIIASLFQIMEGNLDNLLVDPFSFKDKIIFVGGSAAGLKDLKNTPMSASMPGVLVHASIASNILKKDFLTPPNPSLTQFLILILAFVTAFSSLLPKQSWMKNLLPATILSAFLFISFTSLKFNYVIETVTPVLSILIAWAASFSILVFTEGKEKRRFKRMMSQYLSPAVLSTVVNNHDEFAKAEIGSKENLSILFSDIRSFTNMSENLPPEKVVDILNHYFSSMTDAIFQYQGTIDKFIGDAIMAFWGAPLKTDNHADQATLSALDMIKKLETVNQWCSENNYPLIAIGIGIHTGDAILGNIGSENKLDYTVIGDNVNLASRIEGLTKNYACPILITEDTFRALKLNIPCRLIDLVRVKGKQRPIKVYQPLLHPEITDTALKSEAAQLAENTDKAFQFYLSRNWDAALTLLQSLPDDIVTRLLRERCLFYLQNPPEPEWDGVHTMKTK